MGFPTVVAESIDTLLGEDHLPPRGVYAKDVVVECEGAAFHSPTPLTLVSCWITPIEMADAPDVEDLTVMLCPTCSANLIVLQDLLLASEGALPWVVRRGFGNALRAIALRGWDRYKEVSAGA